MSRDSFDGNITRDNHFVPQAILKRWSANGSTIWTYPLLVPHKKVDHWQERSIKGSAVRRDLYTSVQDGQESDAIEKWLTKEFELPGVEASERLINGARLNRDDWHALIRFYALQEVRTPLSFVEFMATWGNYLPGLIEDSTKEAISRMMVAKATGKPVLEPRTREEQRRDEEFSRLLTIRFHEPEEGDEGLLETTVAAGRGLWMFAIRHLLEGRALNELLTHEWSIIRPAGDIEWPLTDHPSLRVGFRSEMDYTFGGGWGRTNTDLMMPLSPRHLLHAQVGKRNKRYGIASTDLTLLMRRLLLRRAYQFIFATSPLQWVKTFRPRTENAALYKENIKVWERWHENNVEAESREKL